MRHWFHEITKTYWRLAERYFVKNWRKLTQGPNTLSLVQGYLTPFFEKTNIKQNPKHKKNVCKPEKFNCRRRSFTKSFTHYKEEYLKTTSKREVRVITLCRFCVLSHFQLKNGDDQVLGAKVLSQFHKLFPIQ